MAQKPQIFDVWIVETNTVYRDVPYTVVTDWVQQGRLLGEDQLRPAGTEKWHHLDKVSAFAAYLPKPEPFHAEDRAEALEPVRLDIAPTRRRMGGEDDDVDMIPLIDVSLVLLIFFMLTTTVSSGRGLIDTPEAEHQFLTIEPGTFWVGIDRESDGTPVYSFGQGEDAPEKTYRDFPPVLQDLSQRLDSVREPVSVRIRAHRELPLEAVERVMEQLQPLKNRRKILNLLPEVSEKKR